MSLICALLVQLAKRKAQRDEARLKQQREDLRRQLARWVAPEEMRDLQRGIDSFGAQQESEHGGDASGERHLTEKERAKAARVEAEQQEDAARRSARMAERYSRHAMAVHLTQVLVSLVSQRLPAASAGLASLCLRAMPCMTASADGTRPAVRLKPPCVSRAASVAMRINRSR